MDLAQRRLVERARFELEISISLVAFTDNLHLFQGDRMPRRGKLVLELRCRCAILRGLLSGPIG